MVGFMYCDFDHKYVFFYEKRWGHSPFSQIQLHYYCNYFDPQDPECKGFVTMRLDQQLICWWRLFATLAPRDSQSGTFLQRVV